LVTLFLHTIGLLTVKYSLTSRVLLSYIFRISQTPFRV
jgi:hypothetical protein